MNLYKNIDKFRDGLIRSGLVKVSQRIEGKIRKTEYPVNPEVTGKVESVQEIEQLFVPTGDTGVDQLYPPATTLNIKGILSLDFLDDVYPIFYMQDMGSIVGTVQRGKMKLAYGGEKPFSRHFSSNSSRYFVSMERATLEDFHRAGLPHVSYHF